MCCSQLHRSLFLVGSGLNNLLLEVSWLGEADGNLLGGELVIAVDNSVYLALHLNLVKWVQIDFLVLLTVEGDSGSSSGDAGWEDDIVQDLLVDVGESSGSWSHLTWVMLSGWRDNGPVGNNNNWFWCILGLKVLLDQESDLLEGAERSVWDSDKEVFAGFTISLVILNGADAVDKDDAKMSFVLFVGLLELGKGFCNFVLEVSWLLSGFLDYFISFIEHV
jgi:hypothetical protein